jgi:pilus assembly protein CpaC
MNKKFTGHGAFAWGGAGGVFIAVLLALMVLAPLTTPVWGADPLGKIRDQEITQTLRLKAGQSKVLRLPFAITRISVANPEVADIILTSPQEVYVNGLSPGVTNLSVWGRGRFSSARVTVAADLGQLKENLAQVLPKEKIGVMTADESVVLTGEVSGPVAQQTAISLAAATVGGKKERVINLLNIGGVQQVMCEVRVAEINRTVLNRIGVNFAIGNRTGPGFGVSLLNNLTGINQLFLNANTANIPSGSIVGNSLGNALAPGLSTAITSVAGWQTGSVLWAMFFDALKQNGLGRILAEPNLVTTSGQEASFLAGGEYPIPVPQQFQTITIEYKKFGVGLNFTPTVLDNNMIAMQVSPEVSELDFSQTVAVGGFVIPALRVRRMSTHIEVKDGQTFSIAGLLYDNSRNIINKFPVLGSLPILGTLFRSSQYQKAQTELVVLVTPHLVKPLAQSTARLPTDVYVDPSNVEFYLFGCLEGKKKKKGIQEAPMGNVPAGATPAGPVPAENMPAGFGRQSVK